MRQLHFLALILVVIGALNWGLVGAFDFNLVAALFGVDSALSNIVYILVGLSGLLLVFTEMTLIRPRTVPGPRTA